jgi:hypothetical protein
VYRFLCGGYIDTVSSYVYYQAANKAKVNKTGMFVIVGALSSVGMQDCSVYTRLRAKQNKPQHFAN